MSAAAGVMNKDHVIDDSDDSQLQFTAAKLRTQIAENPKLYQDINTALLIQRLEAQEAVAAARHREVRKNH